MRVIVLGGAGNFGARIVRALRGDPAIDLRVAGRRTAPVQGAEEVPAVVLDIAATDFPARLRAMSPDLVIHCAGPFQGQEYGVAQATLAAGAHYLDLADGRRFVVDFASRMNAEAVSRGRVAICGTSTLPALSCAVIEALRDGLASLEGIETVIAPGQLAPRGKATLEAVFGYLGRPFPVWRNARWKRTWGWMDLSRFKLAVGRRLGAACDVPDLELFPARFEGVHNVRFHAALEFGMQHLALWVLAALRRVGLPLPVKRWAVGLGGWADLFDGAAGDKGGMSVSVTGTRGDGARVRRTWQLTAPALHGPEIPSMAAILLARRFSRRELPAPGAMSCMGLLALADFGPEFARWGIVTRIDEEAA